MTSVARQSLPSPEVPRQSPPGEEGAPAPIQSLRLDAVDTLRAGAMMLGVLFHACAPYMHAPMRNFIMPLQEEAASNAPDVVFWVIHAVYMPAFMVVSGFVSFLILNRRGPQAFLKDRSRRLLIPLALSFVFLLPLMYVVWAWGWVERDWASWRHVYLFHFGPDLERNIFGLMHLWFIEYLFIYAFTMWAVVRLKIAITTPKPLPEGGVGVGLLDTRQSAPGRINARFSEHMAPPAPSPTPGSSSSSPSAPSASPPTPPLVPRLQNRLRPRLGAHAHLLRRASSPGESRPSPSSATASAPSNRPRHIKTLLSAGWPLVLPVALVSGYLLVHLILGNASSQLPHGLREGIIPAWSPTAWRFAPVLLLFATSSTWVLLGLVLRFVGAAGPIRRYLVDAAYWTYLTHLLWVGLGAMLLPLDAAFARGQGAARDPLLLGRLAPDLRPDPPQVAGQPARRFSLPRYCPCASEYPFTPPNDRSSS